MTRDGRVSNRPQEAKATTLTEAKGVPEDNKNQRLNEFPFRLVVSDDIIQFGCLKAGSLIEYGVCLHNSHE